ncbi:MAG: hypothetical protein BGO03_03530 [Mesorhizobium sp. 61-13]|nr:MAG: hypothetical protein BGO03_03530 [Mesorhizobium sp. 61-13]
MELIPEDRLNFYELATLSTSQGTSDAVAPAILDYATRPEAQGKLRGLWRTCIGQLNQIVLLREFDSRPSLAAERERARRSSDPFNCCKHLTALDMTSFVPFDFFPSVEIGPRGPLYELRTYHLRPAGLSPLEARWRADAETGAADGGTIIAMYTMDGEPRLMEIRALGDFNSKVADNATYPVTIPGSDDWLMPETTSSLLVPLPSSPLH